MKTTNNDFFKALDELEKTKGIPKSELLEKIRNAMITALNKEKKEKGTGDPHVEVEVDEMNKFFRITRRYTVVEEVVTPENQMSLEEARLYNPTCEYGDEIAIEMDPKELKRITASAAKGVIVQAFREWDRTSMYNHLSEKTNDVVPGTVTKIDAASQTVYLHISGADVESEALLPVAEQIKGETIHVGDTIRVYLTKVEKGARSTTPLVSRTHPNLVKRLFELEVPEVNDKTVEIKNVVREAGSRSKVSVFSTLPEVDPVGACIGPKGARIENIVAALAGEKIDIIPYHENPDEYVKAALSPATVTSVTYIPSERTCRVVVPDSQLSLAIGKSGQNARLAARLTGIRIDIKPESRASWE